MPIVGLASRFSMPFIGMHGKNQCHFRSKTPARVHRHGWLMYVMYSVSYQCQVLNHQTATPVSVITP